jgi:hypothetical protein
MAIIRERKPMSSTTSRRALMAGAAAAVPAAALPAVAIATPAANPDAELLRLDAEWRAAYDEYSRIDDDYDARHKAAEAEYPDVPAALRGLLKDGRTTLLSTDRDTLNRSHVVVAALLGGAPEIEAFQRWHLDLFDQHMAACDAVEARHGCRAAGFACDKAGDRVAQIEDQILETHAHSPAGIAIKLFIITKRGQIMNDFEDGLDWVLRKVDGVAYDAERIAGGAS